MNGVRNIFTIIIYVLGIINFIKLVFHKEEIIEISDNQLIRIKHGAEDIHIELSEVNEVNMKTEGNWAVRKDTLVFHLPEGVVELIVSTYDVDKLKSIIKDVCSELKISNDIE